MNIELVWFLCPIISFLWQAGGTGWKFARKFVIPIILGLTYLYFLRSWVYPLLLALSVFGVLTLPFTLKGDSLKDHWFNWIWIWIAGYLLGLPCFLITFNYNAFLFALAPCIAEGIAGTLSNIKATSALFQWKLCEGLIGFFFAVAYALGFTSIFM